MSKKPFIFNDESVKNSYGFAIPTKGISLKRFKKNPIMLDSHYNSTRSVLGKWENITVKGGLLLGEPLFDSEDESVTSIEGKVERGFISSCSMGITFNREDLKIVAGQLVLEKCELYEVSIVAVPSNANSIRLYADGADEPLSDDEVQKLCLSVLPVITEEVPPTPNHNNNLDMKITLTVKAALALGFKETELEHEVSVVNEAAVKLQAKLTAANVKLGLLEDQVIEQKELGIKNKVALAIKANPTLKKQEEKLVELGLHDEALLDATLDALPKKASLGAQISNPEGGDTAVKTAEDFQKLTLKEQLAFKADQPDAYKLIFNIKQ